MENWSLELQKEKKKTLLEGFNPKNENKTINTEGKTSKITNLYNVVFTYNFNCFLTFL